MAYLFGFLSAAMAAMSLILGKLALIQEISSAQYVFLMTFSAALIAFSWIRLTKPQGALRLPKTFEISFWGHSLFVSLALWCLWKGVETLDPAAASFLSRFECVVTAILAVFILNERFSLLEWVGVGLAIVGVVIMRAFSVGESTLSGQAASGYTYILISTVSFAAAEAFSKVAANKMNPVPFAFYRNVVVSSIFGVVLLIQQEWQPVNWDGLVAIVASAFFGPFLARVFYMQTLKKVPLLNASAMSQSEPLFAAVIGFVWLGTLPTQNEWLGGMLVIVGCCTMIVAKALASAPPITER